MKQIGVKDREFYKKLFLIALPIALQNLISSSLNMVDTVMIGQLGETNIAAVGLANQVFFLMTLLLFGTNSGSGIFIAQFWGKRDVKNIRRVLGIAIAFGGIISLVFTIGAIAFPAQILRLYSKDASVVLLGSKYLRIVGLSYILTAVSFAFGFASRSVGHAALPMVISAVSLGCNTLLNWILIFGHFGFKPMGVEGAAIATVIARVVELILMITIVYKCKYPLAGTISEMTDVSKEFIKKFFKTTTPVILNEGLWALGTTMYSAAYARINTQAVASVQIANTIQSIFMVICFGIGNACAVMLGNKIGEGKKEDAFHYVKKFSIIGPVIGIIIGAVLIICAHGVLESFKVSPRVYKDAYRILIAMGAVMGIKVFNLVLIVGILRSGGDTKYALCLEASGVWLVGVPLAFLGALVLKLPVYWVYVLVCFEEVVKVIFGIPRVISKKWLKEVV